MQWMTEETGWIMPEETGLPGQLSEGMPCFEQPDRLLRLGAGLAAAAQRCAVGYEPDTPRAKAAAMLLAGAAAAAGGNAVLVPDCAPVELGDASAAAECGIALHVGENRLRVCASGLLPLTKRQEAAIGSAYAAEPRWMQGSEYGGITDGRGLRLLYAARLTEQLPADLPAKLQFSTASARLLALHERIFRGGHGETLTVQMTGDGRRCSLYSERLGWIFYEKLLLMLCMHRLAAGEDVALPYWVPQIAEEMAAAHGRRILRYASRSDGSDTEARTLARRQGFTLDAGSMLAEILRIHAESEPDLRRWMQAIPACHTVRRILPTEDAEGAAARCGGYLHAERTPEGVRLRDPRGTALLRPSATGRSLAMLVEARSMETASELAADIAGWIARRNEK